MKRIFVNGTFDILHRGHLELLSYARSLGDHLTVGIDSDRRVQEKKGQTRPINSYEDRAIMLKHIRWVDDVKEFDTDEDLINLIKNCDIMVKGSDYRGQHIIGADVCPEIIYFERLDPYSTTKKIQDITNR